MNLLIKFPTRARYEKFFAALDTYYDNLECIENVRFLIACDNDDPVMNNPEVIAKLSTYKNLKLIFTDCKTKIEAVNVGVSEEEFDIVLIASDDMIPVKKGFDRIIIALMEKYYPDTDGVLWFNDGLQGARLNTLSILGRKYYDRFGYIYHPEYKSLFCDNEFTEISVALNKVIYCKDVIIEHRHVDLDHSLIDDLHLRNDKWLAHDRETWNKRKANNYV